MTNFPIRVTGERHFHPFHLLINAAEESFEHFQEYQLGGFSFALSTVLLSALALEGLVNSLGESKIQKWSDFESTQLIGKLRIICNALDIEFVANHQPWQHVGWLVKLRNQLAHAKPKKIKIDEIIEEHESEKLLFLGPTELEKSISKESAEKALATVNGILSIFLKKLDPKADNAFFVPH